MACEAADTEASASGSTIRVTRKKVGQSTPIAGSFTIADVLDPANSRCEGIPVGATAEELLTALRSAPAFGTSVFPSGSLNGGQHGNVEVHREVFGHGSVDQFTYVITWDTRASTYLKEFAGDPKAMPPTLTVSLQPSGGDASHAEHIVRQRLESAWVGEPANPGTVYEVQTISILKTFSGSFHLGFNSDETDSISSGVALGISTSSTDMKVALESIFNEEAGNGQLVDVTSSETATAKLWSVTFAHSDYPGGHNGSGECVYDYYRKQCKRDPSSGHDCRQHDGTSRNICTGATELLRHNYNGATTDTTRRKSHSCTGRGTSCRSSRR